MKRKLIILLDAELKMIRIAEDADEIVCLKMPPYFGAIGRFYLEFTQVDDDELLEILKNQSKC